MRCLISVLLVVLSFDLSASTKQVFPFKSLPSDIHKNILLQAISNNQSDIPRLYKTNKWFRENTRLLLAQNPHLIHYSTLSKTPSLRSFILSHFNDERMSKTERWIESAITAAKENKEPDHLLEIVNLENKFFEFFLKQKELTLTTLKELKKHAFITIMMFRTIRVAQIWTARNVFRRVSWSPAFYASFYAGEEAAIHSANDIFKDTALCKAEEVFSSAIFYEVHKTSYDEAWMAAFYAAICVDSSEFWNSTFLAAKDATKKAKMDKSWKSLSEEDKSKILDRISYRVSETVAWISALNPKFKILESSYDTVNLKMSIVTDDDLNSWFGSQEKFDSKINKLFIENKNLDDYSRKLLASLVDHLRRIGKKIFPEDRPAITNE